MATDQATAEMIWHHTLTISYSLFYLTENADGIRQERSHNESIHWAHVHRADDFYIGCGRTCGIAPL
jgi:hypothetical protein